MQQSPPDVPEDDETDSDDRPQTRGHNKLQQRRTRRKPGRRDAEGPDISTQPQGHVTRERGGSTSDGRRRLERPRIEREEDSWGMNQNPNAQQYPQRGQRERDDYRPTDHGAQSDREYYQRPPVLRGDSKQRMQAQRQPPRRERDVEKYQIGSDDELEIANMYKQALILS
ncbi:hypothetical protein PUNSTDRAFT_52099 [Punctularia strigosozonata HHB-11173 SS5]|uniref:uncharacterized protein n=1 Tax=Punctularia strigosozonata (strain HHB-11173) TaxID=741275 RepID=UPI000441740F|nr:uncharacterized protein PUNSTDRAFT_52099 [Punctularia strigosozonata HHB-11173 SS5]EIN09973.1 hypothetical protein PUNSTDRAFT_52099 [Punctularia strigosozonata HHB-11173 SS5]